MAALRALECLVEARPVTAVAASHMSQPALSHQISALERELGTAVVARLFPFSLRQRHRHQPGGML
ncbi:helix-turn-helix domain-containing protein [Actinoallomurus acaciae]|uniref:LysR family transcriptional regulator n=1 Tax=Actinoallomurus acaciae TaxID=502577 RepID=A0ABV5YAK2_9ACTN